VHKVLALQGGREQAGDRSAHQHFEGSVRDQQAALHASAVLDGRPDVLIRQFPAIESQLKIKETGMAGRGLVSEVL